MQRSRQARRAGAASAENGKRDESERFQISAATFAHAKSSRFLARQAVAVQIGLRREMRNMEPVATVKAPTAKPFARFASRSHVGASSSRIASSTHPCWR